MANVDGTGVTQITPSVPLCDATVIPRWIDREPQWSPDGTRIAVTRDYQCEPELTTNYIDIVVMNADGTGVVNVTNTPDWESSQDWSPDGLKFVYDGGDWSIHVINADGSGHETLIPSAKKMVQDPDWRP